MSKTDKQMSESIDSLSDKLKNLLESHFGVLPGLSSLEDSIDNVYISGEALTATLAKVAVTFGLQKASFGMPLEDAIDDQVVLFIEQFQNNLNDLADELDDLQNRPISN